MKMRENSGKKLKGSVLFTVIAVMMVVLVFVMSALTIAGATSRRAYSDYAKKQTQSTARTAIEATLKYINENEALKSKIESLSEGSKINDVKVQFKDSASEETKGIGDIRIEIECVKGKKTAEGENIVKIKAISGMLDDETSVVAYVGKKPPTEPNSPFTRAMTSMGSASIGNNISVYGGTSVNVLPDVESYEKGDGITSGDEFTKLADNGYFRGKTFLNGNIKISTQGRFIFDNPGDGFILYGSFWESNGSGFYSNVKNTGLDLSNHGQIPYIFIRDTFFPKGSNGQTIGTDKNPVNVYCGNIVVDDVQGKTIYGDLYTFGSDSDYDIDSDNSYYEYGYETIFDDEVYTETGAVNAFLGQSETKLLHWVEEVTGTSGIKLGGNMYFAGSMVTTQEGGITSMNPQLKVNGNVYIQQGAYIRTKSQFGELNEGKPVDESKGILYVGGALNVASENAFKANKLMVYGIDKIKFKDTPVYKPNPHGPPKVEYTRSSFELWNGTEFVKYDSTNIDTIKDNPNFIDLNLATNEGARWTFPSNLTYPNILSENGGFVPSQEESVGEYYGSVPTGGNGYYAMKTPSADDVSVVYKLSDSSVQQLVTKTDDATGAIYTVWEDSESVKFNSSNVCKIQNSCTLTGSLNGRTLIIEPAEEEIWIKLDNFSAYNNAKIIVEDKRDTDTGMPLTKVKFYTDNKFELNGTKLVTRTYFDILGGKLDIKQTPSTKEECEYIPNIYLYMGEGGEINLSNGAMITGYVYAPYGKVTAYTPYQGFSEKIYNGKDVETDSVMFIGAVVCGDIYSQNNSAILYINPNGDGSDDGEKTPGSYRVLYYNND